MATEDNTEATRTLKEQPGRLGLVVVVVISLAAFGPYVLGSIRTEQLAIYLLAFLLLPLTFVNGIPRFGLWFLVTWVAYVSVALLGAAFPTVLVARWESGNLLAGLDNILLPIAVMMLVWTTTRRKDSGYVLRSFARIVVIAMAANGALAIIATRIDLSPLLRPFWTNASSEGTTAELAAQLGRFGGIFNQPAEAGVMYGVAGLLAVYLWSGRQRLLITVLTLIVVGGLISVSKIFILGALPLILFYWLRSRRGGGKIGLVVGGLFVVLGVVQSGLLSDWIGVNYLARLIGPSGDAGALNLYTAGRFEEDSGFSQVLAEVWRINPISGVGVAGWAVPYDSFVAESMAVGGLIGLALYTVIFVVLFIFSRRVADKGNRLFVILFAVLVVGAGLGFSPLTGNRASTIVWVLISLIVLSWGRLPVSTSRAKKAADSVNDSKKSPEQVGLASASATARL